MTCVYVQLRLRCQWKTEDLRKLVSSVARSVRKNSKGRWRDFGALSPASWAAAGMHSASVAMNERGRKGRDPRPPPVCSMGWQSVSILVRGACLIQPENSFRMPTVCLCVQETQRFSLLLQWLTNDGKETTSGVGANG